VRGKYTCLRCGGTLPDARVTKRRRLSIEVDVVVAMGKERKGI